jgi:simple sugar transport system permease protein
VILAGWRPWLALIGAYAFGALRGLGFTLQIAQVDIPSDFLTMIPFIAAYLVVVAVSASPSRARRVAAPAALGEPYRREER